MTLIRKFDKIIGKSPHSLPKGPLGLVQGLRVILIMTSPDKVGYFNYGPGKLKFSLEKRFNLLKMLQFQ
jgi:hypothetical protein